MQYAGGISYPVPLIISNSPQVMVLHQIMQIHRSKVVLFSARGGGHCTKEGILCVEQCQQSGTQGRDIAYNDVEQLQRQIMEQKTTV